MCVLTGEVYAMGSNQNGRLGVASIAAAAAGGGEDGEDGQPV